MVPKFAYLRFYQEMFINPEDAYLTLKWGWFLTLPRSSKGRLLNSHFNRENRHFNMGKWWKMMINHRLRVQDYISTYSKTYREVQDLNNNKHFSFTMTLKLPNMGEPRNPIGCWTNHVLLVKSPLLVKCYPLVVHSSPCKMNNNNW